MSRKGGEITPEAAIRRRRIRIADRRSAYALIRKAAVLGLVVYGLFAVAFGLTAMKGGDMQPKFAAGDLLLYYRLNGEYARGDVVVMKRDGSQYVGRIVAMPGETVEVTEARTLRVNGQDVIETEIFYETQAFQEAVEYPLQLGNNEYFLLGDMRETAKDGRYFGATKASEIKGKVISALRRTDL